MSIEAKASAAIAAGSGLATYLAAAEEVAIQILGVPLPVVLAAGTGAWIARSYTPAANLGAALLATAGWTVAGCVVAPLGQALAKGAFGIEIPTNGLAGLALAASWALPMFAPILREKLPDVLRARLDRWKDGQ